GQQYPFTQNQSLGSKFGFVCTVAATRITYSGCIAKSCTSNGFDLRAGSFFISGCSSTSNGGNGFSFSNTPVVRMHGGSVEGGAKEVFSLQRLLMLLRSVLGVAHVSAATVQLP